MNACLIRHTRVIVPAGLCYGRSDVPLAETFAEDAEAVRRALPWTPGEIWTSPARRCVELARRLAEGRIAVRTDGRLRELHFGDWEGRRWEEFRGEESESWARDPWAMRPPGGETGGEMWARVAAVRTDVLAARTRVAVVTHAGVIRLWRGLAAGRPPHNDLFAARVGWGEIGPAE